MAMMAKMRSLAPAFIISVGALFVLFMVISDSNVLEALGGRTNSIGSVNGEEVTYNEYAELLNQQVESQKKQTGKDLDEEQMEQLREQVWDALVTQKLIAKKMEQYEISVSDEEIKDAILGENPPQFLKQNFIDSTGAFNRQMYESALFDSKNREALLQAEEYVRQTRLSEKLQSMLLASVTLSEQEIKNKFIDQNITINANYALVDVNQYPDSLFNVTDEDLKNYYNENLDKYKVEGQRKLNFVLFNTLPSEEDSLTAKKMVNNITESFKQDTLSFKSTVEIYSSAPYSKDTLAVNAFPESIANKISSTQKGQLLEPEATQEGYVLYKLADVVTSKEPVVRASHILINQFGSDEKNLEEANKVYQQLVGGADFATLAMQLSQDPGSGKKGGDLGWFSKGAMVPEFEKACFSGKVGEVQKPIKTNYGYHIIKVVARTDKKYVVEKIVIPIETSATTKDLVQNNANDFTYLANKNSFEKEAELMQYTVKETMPFNAKAYSIPNLGVNKRLVTWAFDNDLDDVSPVFRIPTGFVVAKISEVTKEGARPFDEVKAQIKPQVIREKKFEKALKAADGLRAKINGDLNKVTSVDSKIKVQATGNFTPGGSVPTVGRDYAFIETALNIKLKTVSQPVKGFRGYYLIDVIERSDFDSSAYAIQRNTMRDQLMQEKRNAYFSQWLAKLKEEATIKDNRNFD
ncbi:MAG: peptidylprolyl isomerase [Ignavibacteriaceae bacterium]|nr:peptidylprolyl isomerase [Ignavibacteriaceae bacterium]